MSCSGTCIELCTNLAWADDIEAQPGDEVELSDSCERDHRTRVDDQPFNHRG